ncbi:hypothetical protein [Legionella sp.]|uniref:hypothetical protein n=1 Tax=Legionella sp. TaxID=459 RepID=UPI003CA600E1
MYLIINSECNFIPQEVQPLTSSGTALLNLLYCLGYDAQNPPLADLLRRVYSLQGNWLVLSPVHWQATHNDALIVATGKDLELQEDETKLWFDLFSDYLGAEGWRLYYHDAETWLLCDRENHPLKAKPPQQLLGKSLMSELTQLDHTLFWQKFITESQMLFASKPNQSGVNGLWPWGNAKLIDKTITICADEFFLSMAKMCGTNVTKYSPSIKLKEQQILLLTEFSILSEQHQEELKKLVVHWYWNNIAYTSSNSSWFIRLWRKIIYAN